MKKIGYILTAALLILTSSTSNGESMQNHLPKIVILATGGTIAGSINSKIATSGYTPGALSIETLINAVPEMKQIADISGEQIANIGSEDMTDDIWLELADRINKLLKTDVAGIVITHGTDTMEETAFFLNLVVKSDKPVVLVGAMRPATATSADGPKNLYNAVALAANPESRGRGVMIAMDDIILGARDATKTNTVRTDTFKSPNSGPFGTISDGVPHFYMKTAEPNTINTEFDVKNLKTLPKVDILYSYENDGSGVAAQALVKAGTKGLVIAGSGAGSIHKFQKSILKELIKNNHTAVVCSSRTGSGYVPLSKEYADAHFIGAGNLNPQKARVLLMLALTVTNDPKKIQEIFNKY